MVVSSFPTLFKDTCLILLGGGKSWSLGETQFTSRLMELAPLLSSTELELPLRSSRRRCAQVLWSGSLAVRTEEVLQTIRQNRSPQSLLSYLCLAWQWVLILLQRKENQLCNICGQFYIPFLILFWSVSGLNHLFNVLFLWNHSWIIYYQCLC